MKYTRIAAVLTAAIGALVIFMATMVGHERYREKLIQQPVRPTAGSVLVKVGAPKKTRDAVLLLEIRIKSGKTKDRALVTLNRLEIGRIQAYGHHFIKIPRALFQREGNGLSFQGLPADSALTVLELKNLYGFSTGLLRSVMVQPGAPGIERLPWPLAAFLALLLLALALRAPKSAALNVKNRWLRYLAWLFVWFLLAVLLLPWLTSIQVFLGWETSLLLIAVLYWPGFAMVLRRGAELIHSRALPFFRSMRPRLVPSPSLLKLLAGLALAAIFVFYAVHRQRYVGAADWYGYYAESLLFQQGQLTMKPTVTQARHLVAFTPLGFYASGTRMIPQYPPGFPLLLALFGFIGLEFFVNALCGVLTILFLYLILNEIVGRVTALFYAALWAFFPMTIWGSVYLMSDLVATLFILMTYYFFRRGIIFWSGIAFSYAVVIRPSCVLFFIIFLPLLLKKKKLRQFCLAGAVIGSLYGLYNWSVFGKPWITGYGSITRDLIGSVFWHHFLYYGKTMLIIMTPLLIIPALWALVRRNPRKWFYFSWLAGFWIFYSFWKSGADAWWYLRFLLPGLPALFILSAVGAHEIRGIILARRPGWKRTMNFAAVLLLLVMIFYFYNYAERDHVLTGDKGDLFYRACNEIQSLLPADALVGGLEMSGPINLYTRLESFRWDLKEGLAVIRDFLEKGRPLYLAVEPWHKQHPAIKEIDQAFMLTHVRDLQGTYGMQLLHISLRPE